MEILRWGIIGCGDVCEVKSGPAFQKVPDSELIAVMRRNGGLAADFARRHAVPKWYTDAQALINDPDVTAIYIATPPSTHAAYAMAAMAAGKPVYVEKPMAHTAHSAREMADVANATGNKLCVAHYRRQQPLFLKVKELLEAGAIGQVRHINLQYTAPANAFNLEDERIRWRLNPSVSGGGFFHDLAPHQLDLLFYFFGSPLKVQGLTANTTTQYKVPDGVSSSLLFKKNILATCNWFFSAPDGLEEDFCQITGAKGTLRFSIFGKPHLQLMQEGQHSQIDFEPLPHVQQPMIAAVTQYFLGKGENPCPADAGVLVMDCMEAITM